MPRNFFVIGLPRSRTAWMSVFLTTLHTYCYHEGLKYRENVEGWQKMLSRDDYLHVGDSGCNLASLDLGKLYPDAPVVVVERDTYDAAGSLVNLLGHEPGEALDQTCDRRTRMSDAIRHCNNVIRVDYNDINDKLEDIWTHCIGKGFDANRADHLIEMNIQAQYLSDDKFMGFVKLCAEQVKEVA